MRIVIIGGGPAAVESAVAARKNAPDAEVEIYSAEEFLPYRRPALSGLLAAGKKADPKTFFIKSTEFFDAEKIGFHPGSRAVAIEKNHVTFADGRKVAFDKLILACGSEAVRPPIPGAEKGWVLRSLSDMEKLAARLDEGVKSAVIIGGGVLGLEIADSLLSRQIDTVVLEVSEQLFPGKLSANEAAALKERLSALPGLQIICGRSVENIGDDRVVLLDGTVLPAEIVIIAAGCRPDLSLARSAGLECGRGVKVNEFMQSSVENIFACGDTAELNGKCFCLYMDAMAAGKIAGANAAGQKIAFTAKVTPVRLMALGEKLVMA